MAPSLSSSFLPSTEPPLKIYNTISSLRTYRRTLPQDALLGFVPTMGALHEGHLSLLRAAAAETSHVFVSIFVNPAQFGPTEDLGVYPRTLASDLTSIHSLNREFTSLGLRGRIEALFLPSVEEMYPSGIPLEESAQRGAFVTVQPLASKLEGVTRPHFFRGVATVCSKLFNIVQPDKAYFGQKDVQQTVVLKRLVRDLHFPIHIRVCETGREEDGLAMSSRNVYLGEKRRKVAPVLYKALRAAEEAYKRLAVGNEIVDSMKVKKAGIEVLEKTMGAEGVRWEVEYFSLADPAELEELEQTLVAQGGILSAAIRMKPTNENEGPVRLIDNIILPGRQTTVDGIH